MKRVFLSNILISNSLLIILSKIPVFTNSFKGVSSSITTKAPVLFLASSNIARTISFNV